MNKTENRAKSPQEKVKTTLQLTWLQKSKRLLSIAILLFSMIIGSNVLYAQTPAIKIVINESKSFSGTSLEDAVGKFVEGNGINNIKQLEIKEGTLTTEDWQLLASPGLFKWVKKLTIAPTMTSVDTIPPHFQMPSLFTHQSQIEEFTFFKVKTLANFLFYDCDDLTTASLPNVENIKYNQPFSKCDKLRTLKLGKNPPKAYGLSFQSLPKDRNLVLVDELGNTLTGDELDEATLKYKTVFDGDNKDNKWWGWTLPNIPVKEISLNTEEKWLNYDEQFTLNATVIPAAATNPKVVWTSNNHKVAYVNQEGQVRALYKDGTAIITATTEDGNKKAQCTIHVKRFLEININDQNIDYKGKDLEHALSQVDGGLGSIQKLKTKSGKFTSDDWTYLRDHRNELNALTHFESVNYKINNIPNTTLNNPYFNKGKIKNVIIKYIKRIGDNAFSSCSALTEVSLANVTTIGENAFKNCNKLAKLNIPWTPPTITNTNAFNGLPTNRSLTFLHESGVTIKDRYALEHCIRAYRAINDGNTNDNKWYGWTLPDMPVKEVRLSKKSRYFNLNESFKLTAYVLPADAVNKNITWTSDNPSIASVNEDGLVTAHALGTATITVTTEDGNKTATCSIFVTEDKITIKVNDQDEYTGTNLQHALSRVSAGVNSVAKLDILLGDVTKEDWRYIKNSVKNITHLTIHDAINTVADIPESTFDYSSKLQEINIAKVKNIEHGAFYYCTNLTKVNLPEAENIKGYVFKSCYTLIEVNLPKAKEIKYEVFENCHKLTSVKFPNVESIGKNAFVNCDELTSIDLPKATSIGEKAFSNCEELTSINLPQVTSIEKWTFVKCYKLISIDLPKVTSIGIDAFDNCRKLKSVNAPKLTNIEELAFHRCKNLIELKLGNTPPTATGKDIFKETPDNRSLTFVDENGTPLKKAEWQIAINNYKAVDDGNTTDYKWYGWEIPQIIDVTGVSLNETSTEIALESTITLTATIEPSNATNKKVTWSSSDDNIATVSNGVVTAVALGTATITVTTADGGKTATCQVMVTPKPIEVTGVSLNLTTRELKIGDTFKLIPTITPNNATNKNVTWSSSDDNIATVNTKGVVTAVAVGDATITVTTEDGKKTTTCAVTVKPINVISISLSPTTKELNIGDKFILATTIEPHNATNKNVTWSSSNDNIVTVNTNGELTAVAKGDATITVTTADGGKTATCAVTVKYAIKLKINDQDEYEGNNLEDALSKVNGGLSSIKKLEITEGKFTYTDWDYLRQTKNSFTALTHFIVNNNIKITNVSISSKYFSNTIQHISIPTITKIGGINKYIVSVNFPDATTINFRAFYQHKNLTTVNLPKAESIGDEAFFQCTNLTNIKLPKAKSIGKTAFYGCSALATISLPEAESIGTRAFFQCTNLTNIKLPKAKNIDKGVFSTCSALTSVSLPNVTSIGEWSFSTCKKLTELKVGKTAPTATSNSFDQVPENNTLTFINEDGTELTGIELQTAISNYKAVDDGNTNDNKWYVWFIETIDVTAVSLSETTKELKLSKTFTLTPIFTPAEATNKKVTWSSSDETIASVDENGVVTANAEGTAIITVTTNSGGKTATCTVTVLTSNIAIKVNDQETIYGGDNLKEAVKNTGIKKITKLEIIAGNVVTDDWKYLKGNYYKVFSSMTHFTVTDNINTVADLPNIYSNEQYFNLHIQSVSIAKIKNIGDDAFRSSYDLTTLKLPEVTNIGTRAFFSCGLTSLSLPKVTNIGTDAFSACYDLTSVSLPKVTSIDNYAFKYCTNLTELKLGKTPPTVKSNTFTKVPKNNLLTFINEDGIELTGSELQTAINNYKAVDDGNTNDNKWYGWKITIDKPIVISPVNYIYGDVATPLTATALDNHTLRWYNQEEGGTALTTAPTPSTNTVGTQYFWVSQVKNGTSLESLRAKIEVIVKAKPITVTANSGQSKVYGENDPAITYTVTPELINNDKLNGSLSRVEGNNVGSYTITKGNLSHDNYSITVTKNVKFKITPKPITVTADNITKVKGTTEPELTYTTEPTLIAGDKFTGKLKRDAGEELGEYAIKQGTLSAGSNYTITFIEGKLTIVEQAIAVTGVSIKYDGGDLEVDQTAQLKAIITPDNATNKAVTWSSSNENIATINSNGMVTAIAVGTTKITVTTNNGNFTANVDLTVVPKVIAVTGVSISETTKELNVGENFTLTATIEPTDATNKNVTWSSSNEDIVTVENGIVTAVAEGNATITVTTEDGSFTASCNIKVNTVAVTGISISETTKELNIGENFTLTATVEPNNATNKNVTWSSSDKAIATVDNGVVTAVAEGNATITVTTEDGSFTASCNVKVNTVAVTGISISETAKELNVGENVTLTATIQPENATNKNVTWSSSDKAIATVDNGVVTAIAKGNATITVTTEDGAKTATCEVTVVKNGTGINDNITNTTSIYPTIVNNRFTIETSQVLNTTSELWLSIYNQAGAKVKTVKLTSNKQFIDVSDIKQGVYFVQVNQEVFKIIKK